MDWIPAHTCRYPVQGISWPEEGILSFHEARITLSPVQAQGHRSDKTYQMVWRSWKVRLPCIRKGGTFHTDTLSGNHQLFRQAFHQCSFRIIQCQNQGVQNTVQRSKGQGFLSIQANKYLCLINESLRFLRCDPLISSLIVSILVHFKLGNY